MRSQKMPDLLQLHDMPQVEGISVPSNFYEVITSPAPLAGMSRPSLRTPWAEIAKLGFQYVICLTEFDPEYDPRPLQVAHAVHLEDLFHRRPPKDPNREETSIREAVRVAVSKIQSGAGVVVHCAGGTGRTGTVIGCILRELGCHGRTVVDYLDDLNRKGRGRSGWPEATWQADLVLRF
jgi:protein-tyrosine phosphatase